MYDSVIIGSGPAGITAAIYMKRAGLNVVVIGKDDGALGKTNKVENYYGFENPISGNELLENGRKQAKRLGITIVEDEVVLIEIIDNGFQIKTVNSSFEAKTALLATGADRQIPNIKGMKEYEGKGVSYCAICDAFFYRNKKVAVLGSGNYAINEINTLLPVAASVTMITNGEKPIENRSSEIPIVEKKITEVRGDESKIQQIDFEDESNLNIDGLFIAVGVASSTALARKIGAMINGKNIVVNEKQQTNVPGLYAAGDCTGGILQISKATYEGMKAGLDIIQYIKKTK